MLTVTRSPLTSPVIRTVISASSYPSLQFHQAGPSSTLSHSPSSPLPLINLPPESPRLSSSNCSGSPASGYFNLPIPSLLPSHLSIANSPQFLTPPLIDVRTPPVAISCHGKLTCTSNIESLTSTEAAGKTFQHSSTRRRPSFTLDISRPGIVRDDSFEAVALAGVNFTPGTPGELEWCNSFDSVVTLKPSNGRVATPYPKHEKGWLDGNDLRAHIQTRS